MRALSLGRAVLTVLGHSTMTTNDIVEALRQKGWGEVAPDDVEVVLAGLAFAESSGGWSRRPGLPTGLSARQASLAEGIDPARINDDASSPANAGPVRPLDGSCAGSDEWRRLCAEITAALADEIGAARRSAADHVPLTEGRPLDHKVARVPWLYEYSTAGALRIPDGTEVEVKLGANWYDAEVVSSHQRSLVLTGSASLPRSHRDAELRYDLLFLLRQQQERWDELSRSTAGFDWQSALAVRNGDAPNALAAIDEPEDGHDARLNPAQRLAVRRATAGGTTWIWGPPGTGKTTTLATIVDELVRSGRRTLLVSNTNAALDTAMARCLDDELLPGRRTGDLLRIGRSTHPALTAARPPVLVEHVAAARGHSVADMIVELRSREADANERIEAFETARDDARKGGRLGEVQLLVERRADLIAERALYTVEARRMDRLLALISEGCTSEARVVFATAHRCYLADLAGQRFDVVIIDESSMVPTALALLAVGMGQGHTILAGDFRQLGPIAQADTPPARKWLRRSLFETAGIDRRVTEGRPPRQLVALHEQHRMRKPIAELVSDAFYPENRLITAPSIAGRPALTGHPRVRSEVTLIDTSGLDSWMRKAGGQRSRYNPAHAVLAAALLNLLPETEDVALIAPYSAQARLLEAFSSGERVAAATVHRFQGGERSTVIFDVTEGQGRGIGVGPWFKPDDPSGEGSRLINVALSRAKDRLLILADLQRLGTGDASTPVGRLLRALGGTRGAGHVHRVPWHTLVDVPEAGTHLGTGGELHDVLVEAIGDAKERAVIWSARLPGPNHHEPLAAAVRRARSRGADLRIWTSQPEDAAAWSRAADLNDSGAAVRFADPVCETFAVVDDELFVGARSMFAAQRESRWLLRRDADLADAVVRTAWRKPVAGVAGRSVPNDTDDRGAFTGGAQATVRVEGYLPANGWTTWARSITRPRTRSMSWSAAAAYPRTQAVVPAPRGWPSVERPCAACGIVPNHLARCAC